MATDYYEVINVDELTVHRTVASLDQGDGNVKHQNGMGRTYSLGDLIPAEEVAVNWREALESGEGALYESLKNKLAPASDSPSGAGKAPFEGYDDMDEDDLLTVMRNMPSATIESIKRFENSREEPRERIVNYSIGFGESPTDRQLAVGQATQEPDTDKAVARLTTHEVPEEGLVQPGEGITGTGDPQIPYGVKKDAEESEDEEEQEKAKKGGDIKGAAAKARRGRRDRQPKPTGGKSKAEGGGSLQQANEGE